MKSSNIKKLPIYSLKFPLTRSVKKYGIANGENWY